MEDELDSILKELGEYHEPQVNEGLRLFYNVWDAMRSDLAEKFKDPENPLTSQLLLVSDEMKAKYSEITESGDSVFEKIAALLSCASNGDERFQELLELSEKSDKIMSSMVMAYVSENPAIVVDLPESLRGVIGNPLSIGDALKAVIDSSKIAGKWHDIPQTSDNQDDAENKSEDV